MSFNMPIRTGKLVRNYDNAINICRQSWGEKVTPLKELVTDALKHANKNKNGEPCYYYIFHEKKDVEKAAEYLNDDVFREIDIQAFALKKEKNEEMLSASVQKSKLKRAAKEAGMWAGKLLPAKNIALFLGWLISTLISLSTVATASFDFNGSFIRFIRQREVAGGVIAVFSILSLLLLGFFVKNVVEQNRRRYAALDKNISEMDDGEFLAFIENFTADDIHIPGLSPSREDIDIICQFTNYSFRQRALLMRYWITNTHDERWWIFIERNQESDKYVLNKSQHYERTFFYLQPLSITQKRELAKELGRDTRDPGLRQYGPDYIAKYSLKEERTESLNDRIDRFVEKTQKDIQVNVHMLIYLVAELCNKYNVDFSSGRYWEYLFEYTQKQSRLMKLDRRISEEVIGYGAAGFSGKWLNSIRYLIPLILNEFSEELDKIAIMCDSSPMPAGFSQLCVIKALRCDKGQDEDRCLSIAETIYDVLCSAESNPKLFCGTPWRSITLEAFDRFQSIYFGCFFPSFIHMLLDIYENSKSEDVGNLLCEPVVISIAKANLLLNNSTDTEEESAGEPIDVIYDHYRLVAHILEKRNKANILRHSGNIPVSFGLLNLTDKQRREYYFGLMELKETQVIRCYDLLFYIYCASINKTSRCKQTVPIFRRILDEKYGPEDRYPSEECTKMALRDLAALLQEAYPDYVTVKEDIPTVSSLLLNLYTEDDFKEMLYYLAKWDTCQFVMGNFIACMACLVNGEIKKYRDIYLNMGSYLVRFVFLSNLEMREASMINDDFQYMVHIMVAYNDPSIYLISLLATLQVYPVPSHSRSEINRYISDHGNELRVCINEIINRLEANFAEDCIMFLVCLDSKSIISERIGFYTKVRDKVSAHRESIKNSELLLELLNYRIDGRFSNTFLRMTGDELVNALSNCSPNLAYLLYRDLVWTDENYYALLPELATQILLSDFVAAPILPAMYLIRIPIEKYPDGYFSIVAEKLYGYCVQKLDEVDLILEYEEKILILGEAIQRIANYAKDEQNKVKWFSISKTNALLNRIVDNIAYFTKIKQEEEYNERKWSRYGLISYLIFVLDKETKKCYPGGAKHLNDAARRSWIIENIGNISPLIERNGDTYVNSLYIEMLRMLLENTGNIQEKVSERMLLLRLSEDAKMIVDFVCRTDEEKGRRERLQEVIDRYFSMIQI